MDGNLTLALCVTSQQHQQERQLKAKFPDRKSNEGRQPSAFPVVIAVIVVIVVVVVVEARD